MRIKVPIASQRSCECWINSLCLYQRRWREESVENIDTDMLGCKEVKKEDRESEKIENNVWYACSFHLSVRKINIIYLLFQPGVGNSLCHIFKYFSLQHLMFIISFIYYLSMELEIHFTIFFNIFLCNMWSIP